MKILITGAGGMLGAYVKEQFEGEDISTLGLKEDSDFMTDLTCDVPDLGNNEFELVIHTAGTEENTSAMSLNLEGTRNLLKSLENNPPSYFIYISSYKVYSRDAGEQVNEESNTWATDEAGKSKALAEEAVKSWCVKHKITLSIVRPARMFGNGVKGETLQLFNDALSGKYIHIRDNNAKVSIVCALDVARGLKGIYKKGGIYNAADPVPVRYIDMVEAMTANAGGKKRMTHLPAAWAEWLWRLGRWIPSVQRNLAPETVTDRMKTLTIDGKKFAERSGIEYHDTIAVIERRDRSYPYNDGLITPKQAIHEV